MKTKMKIAVISIALIFMMSIGAALVVPYLSNTVTRDIEVTSPLEISESLTVIDMFGGDEQCLELNVTNHASRNLCGYVEVAVYVDGVPFDCEGMMINGELSYNEECSCGCIGGECDEEDGIFEFPCICFRAGETENINANIVANPGLEPGAYTFETTVMDCGCDWEDYDCECDGLEDCCATECGGGGCLCD